MYVLSMIRLVQYSVVFLGLSLFFFVNECNARKPQKSIYMSYCPKFSFTQLYIRDPNDCKAFHICFGSRSWKMTCPGNTVFSSKYKVCVWLNSPKDDCITLKKKTTSLLQRFTFSPTSDTKRWRTSSNMKKITSSSSAPTSSTKLSSTAKIITTTITTKLNLITKNNVFRSTLGTQTKRMGSMFTKLYNRKTTSKLYTKWWPRKITKWWENKKPLTKTKEKFSMPTSTLTEMRTTKIPTGSTARSTDEQLKIKTTTNTFFKKETERCGEIINTAYIIGGQPSMPGRWPWQVSLQIISAGQPWHRCGGVLVHPLWIVTAAHCVEGPFYGNLKNWRVVLAEGNLEVKSGSEVYRKLSRIISHPGYERASNFPNDIAMLQLDEPVNTYDTNIRMACLPPLETTQLFKEKNCWISGWGETRGSGETNGLNELQVNIVPNGACKSMWGRVDISVLDQQVCVGYGDTGACYGDSGGPLMCEVNGTYYLGGVMSWLINNCSARGFPNVFTRVQSYLDWIHGNIDYYHWWRYS
ncbi:coagulation factor IX [Octopus bimaculoides]|uniref:Peptidase S1 domain-containing protein n=1 Tax=Octopus bimaculoides TaxID=37653 RepID=A0A0L8GBA1_OCTBM|nr:coagulation factor IX [Octopus bimaculoides]|eukprot:XP_014782509.1 PREDICTED: coagulation factor IX-like [Octopus bimaculoides]